MFRHPQTDTSCPLASHGPSSPPSSVCTNVSNKAGFLPISFLSRIRIQEYAHEMRHRCASEMQLRFLNRACRLHREPGAWSAIRQDVLFLIGRWPLYFSIRSPKPQPYCLWFTLFTVQGWCCLSGCVGPCSPLW